MKPSINLFQILYLAPERELERGNIEAAQVALRILSSINPENSYVVQLACVIEAFEDELYFEWPSQWILSKPVLLPIYINQFEYEMRSCSGDWTFFQRRNYAQLTGVTNMLRLTWGLTQRFPVNDCEAFINGLQQAGRRQCDISDEDHAFNEQGVLHIALSYKHFKRWNEGGTINRETAAEACYIMKRFLVVDDTKCHSVRVWVDQNLHRYPQVPADKWYEVGFLPYAVFPVVSALAQHNGFQVAQTRPWIWVETALGMESIGIFCAPKVTETALNILDYPKEAKFTQQQFLKSGYIPGKEGLLVHAVQRVLAIVSWWTSNTLQHSNYEYAEDFIKFKFWARAQVVRLSVKPNVDLSTHSFEDSTIERISWLRALCNINERRDPGPRIRLEILYDQEMEELLELLRVCGAVRASKVFDRECSQDDGKQECRMLYEVFGTVAQKLICFGHTAEKVQLHLNPPPLSDNVTEIENKYAITRLLKSRYSTTLGAFSFFDARFSRGVPPKISKCGTLFKRHYELRPYIGTLSASVQIGGEIFVEDGFSLRDPIVERVYRAMSENLTLFLPESDILCLLRLSPRIQKSIVESLHFERCKDSIGSVLETISTHSGRETISDGLPTDLDADQNLLLSPRELGTAPLEVTNLMKSRSYSRLGHNDNCIVLYRRLMGGCNYVLAVSDSRFGFVSYSFEMTGGPFGTERNPLLLRCNGDIMETLKKTAAIMVTGNSTKMSLRFKENSDEKDEESFLFEGGEFWNCHVCRQTFSPINSRLCTFTKEKNSHFLTVHWNDFHLCGRTKYGEWKRDFDKRNSWHFPTSKE